MGTSGSFKKGYIPWNKGTKGIMKPNKTSFKKGHPAPPTAFKKGIVPWSKGTKGILKGFWKNKKMSERHRKNLSLAHLGQIAWNKGKHPEYMQGKNHPMWKGGKCIDGGGYILIHRPKHPFCDKRGYIRESHLVMEKCLGRYLQSKEIVHHINGNKLDDRIKNLKLFPNKSEHTKFHHLIAHNKQ